MQKQKYSANASVDVTAKCERKDACKYRPERGKPWRERYSGDLSGAKPLNLDSWMETCWALTSAFIGQEGLARSRSISTGAIRNQWLWCKKLWHEATRGANLFAVPRGQRLALQ